MTPLSGCPAWSVALARAQQESRQRGDWGVSLLIPRALDNAGPRDQAWDWIARRYASLFPDWEIVVGLNPGTRWCKGAAVAAAMNRSRGAVLVIADSDCVVQPDALREAVRGVEQGAPWVVPHRLVHRLSEAQTAEWLASPAEGWRSPPSHNLARPSYAGFPGGGLVVVARPAFVATGGIPRIFVGWGEEDRVLALILDGLLGPHLRLGYDLVHLWHPQRSQYSFSALRNRRLRRKFELAAADPAALWRLVQRVRERAA